MTASQQKLADTEESLAETERRLAEAQQRLVELERERARLEGQLEEANRREQRVLTRRLPEVVRRAARIGALRHAFSNPLFDRRWYLEQYSDVSAGRANPYRHYRRHGVPEGRDPNPLFDTDWYLDNYPDVREEGVNPLDHYLVHGAAEGRDPGPLFNTRWYLAQNPDVVASGLNPLLHFLRIGAAEDRLPRPGGSVPRDVGWLGKAPSGDGQALDSRSWSGRLSGQVSDARLGDWLSNQSPALPAGSRLLVVSPTAIPAPRSDALRTQMFPESGGLREGAPGIALVAQLEVERAAGAEFMWIPLAAAAWVAERSALAAHLEDRYGVVARDEEMGELLDLRHIIAPEEAPLESQLRRLATNLRGSTGHDPAILDWTGLDMAHRIERSPVFTAPTGGDLPYLDKSVDIVVVDRDASVPEAQRVAQEALVQVRDGTGRHEVDVVRVAHSENRALPSASIVIPNFNGLPLLKACLRSIAETVALGRGVEVIVADDASDNGSLVEIEQLVQEMPATRLVAGSTNAGFVATANRGAAAAANEYLVLLNNDTVVLPGWLEGLLLTFVDRPDSGVVGGRLLYPDGRLQEAGGLVFRDGSAAKFGYGDRDADSPSYMFVRETDYVSGALLATPRALFEKLGRFDPAYGFGFYEDTDYCFLVHREGLRVIYQPRSVVVHVEGATAGTDLGSGPKRHQAINQRLFAERWAEALAGKQTRPVSARPEDWVAAALRAAHASTYS